jgi:glycerate 2-kinase
VGNLKCKLWDIYQGVLQLLSPDRLVQSYLERQEPRGTVDVLAVGKAAVPMATAALSVLQGRLGRGFLLTKYSHLDTASKRFLEDKFVLREAAHPVPDAAGQQATTEVLDWLEHGQGELLILMSGGASALLVGPESPLNLDDLIQVNSSLLRSGLPIEKMNVLRKHLSKVKGGQLAQRCGRYQTLEQLVLVDICAPGMTEEEVLSLVGSGCFVADPFTEAEARVILGDLPLPKSLAERAEQALHETPKDIRGTSVILASHQSLLREARGSLGRFCLDHSDWQSEITGDVRDVARGFARVARALQADGKNGVLVASGEPTVEIRVDEPGRGGRCQELALYFAREIAGRDGLRLLAGSSDGTDGPTDDAGALVDGRTWPELCRLLGADEMERVLARHDSGTALSRLDGALLRTGPTGQNLNDLYLLQISS